MELEKKYRTEPDSASGLLRIIALKDFSDVKKGDKGGLIQKEKNLSQEGNCWVYRNARVWGDVKIYKNASVRGNVKVWGSAIISDNAYISGNAKVYGDARIYDCARVSGNAEVSGDAGIKGNAEIFGKAVIRGYVAVWGNAKISGNVKLWSSIYAPIDTSIESNKDFTMFTDITKSKICIFPSTLEDIAIEAGEDYVKNIETVRQLYEKEI